MVFIITRSHAYIYEFQNELKQPAKWIQWLKICGFSSHFWKMRSGGTYKTESTFGNSLKSI
jgi:hypothetical protein